MRHRAHPSASQIYTTTVIAAGALLLAYRLPSARFDQPLLFLALLAAAILISLSKVPLPVAGGSATLSMSYFTDLLALMLLGADEAMVIAAASAISQCCFMSRTRLVWYRPLFSAAVLIMSLQAAGLAADALGGFHRSAPLRDLATVTLVTAGVLYIVNSGLVGIAIAQTKGAAFVRSWYRDLFWTAPACGVSAASAALLFDADDAYLWAALLAAGPVYATSKAYRLYTSRLLEQERHLQEVSALHVASVEALARAIDARDQTIDSVRGGTNHIRRVQAWAVALAEAAGMRDGDLEAVRIAAPLHDIGKLAVPEHILMKPGRLTAKEFARVRIHPVVGAEIIKAVPFPYPVASFIRSHHERWDGTGYPDGLRGEAIPLGARVLAVVDHYDALRTPRPYHSESERSVAVAALQAEAGRALDPGLVQRFLEILPRLEAVDVERPAGAPARVLRGQPAAGVDENPTLATPGWVFHNISLATQEMRTLYDIAHTLGTRLSVDDSMALLSSKLARLLPGSCWVLFLHDAEDDTLRWRFATGQGSSALEGMTIPCGSGPSGWAARQRTLVLNACADADFRAAGRAMADPAFQSALACPLIDDERVIGTLTIYHVERNPFCEEHRHLLDQISGQVASVLSNAVAFERLRDASFTDAMTGLPNSRALQEFLRTGPFAATDTRGKHAFIMIDVDGFKQINDGHGHAMGDAALQALANVLRSYVRGSDFCVRCGGDEFAVVLPGCDRTIGEIRAAGLQQAVSRLGLETKHGRLRFGISVGVSAFPEDGSTPADLLAAADQRMYLDKTRRRALSAEAILADNRMMAS